MRVSLLKALLCAGTVVLQALIRLFIQQRYYISATRDTYCHSPLRPCLFSWSVTSVRIVKREHHNLWLPIKIQDLKTPQIENLLNIPYYFKVKEKVANVFWKTFQMKI